jgi:hypothetical protein
VKGNAVDYETIVRPSNKLGSILLAGDSHIGAFGVPIHSSERDYYTSKVEQQGGEVLGLVGPWPRQVSEYWGATRQHGVGRAVALFWGGNIHLANFLFAPAPPFDFVASHSPRLPLDESLEIVPEAMIREFFSPINHLRGMIEKLKVCAALVLVGGTPPPKEDDDFIRRHLHAEEYFENVAAGLNLKLSEMALSPPLLRLKLWLVLQGLLCDIAEETGSVFIPVPAAAQTTEGFLQPDCYADDVTHANRNYGALMVEELQKAVGLPLARSNP